MNATTIVRAALFTPGVNHRWGLPIILIGDPGTAKSSIVGSIARDAGLSCETVIASICEPADFGGLPVASGDRLARLPMAWARKLADAGGGLAFTDEINTCAPATQAALLRVILEGVVGDLRLPSRVRFLAAMNSVEQAAGGWDLAMPLANRFGHLPWDGGATDEWTDWLLSDGGEDGKGSTASAEEEEARVMQRWPDEYAKARGAIAGFMRARPELLHRVPKPGDPAASRAFPTRRTWEMAARAKAGAAIHALDEVATEEFVSAFVGPGAGGEFFAWAQKADLPDPADVLDGRVKFSHDPARLDRTAAVLGGCAALVVPPEAEKKQARGEALWDLLASIVGEAADVAYPAAQAASKQSAGLRMPQHAGFKRVMRKIDSIGRAAGKWA